MVAFMCPECGAGLGKWRCEACGHEVPVVNGIPRFVSSEHYSGSFGFQWQKHQKTQLDSHNGLTISRDRLFGETRWSAEQLAGKTVLECGSGSGRFTEILAETGARVYSFDISGAVEANQKNNGHRDNVTVFQASIYEIPFPKQSFDFVICLGVIQHTPDVGRTVACLAEMVAPGGELCIDCYASPISYLHPRHLIRPFTRGMAPQKLYEKVARWVPRLLPISNACHRVPVIGQALARLVPVANWRANLDLGDESRWREWAVLDTFDWLSPAYESPVSRGQLRRWLAASTLTDHEITRERGLYVVRGSR